MWESKILDIKEKEIIDNMTFEDLEKLSNALGMVAGPWKDGMHGHKIRRDVYRRICADVSPSGLDFRGLPYIGGWLAGMPEDGFSLDTWGYRATTVSKGKCDTMEKSCIEADQFLLKIGYVLK